VASAHLEVVDRRALDGARPPAPESPAGLLRLAGLTDLDGIDLNELERRLRHLTKQLQGADALRRRTLRELLVATLKAAKVTLCVSWRNVEEPNTPSSRAWTTSALSRASVCGATKKDVLTSTTSLAFWSDLVP
jgi:hypothetical protein